MSSTRANTATVGCVSVLLLLFLSAPCPAEEILVMSLNAGGSIQSPQDPFLITVGGPPIWEEGSPQAALPDPNAPPGLAYSYPNPAHAPARPTVHVEAGPEDVVTLSFYTILGEILRSVDVPGPPSVVNAASNPRYAYNYVWDQNVASGVYLCQVLVHRGGDVVLHKFIKLVVIR